MQGYLPPNSLETINIQALATDAETLANVNLEQKKKKKTSQLGLYFEVKAQLKTF